MSGAVVASTAVFASMFLLLGAAAFVAFLWPAVADDQRIRRLLWGSLVLLAVATAADLDHRDGVARIVLLAPFALLLARLRDARQTWWRAATVVVGLALAATPALSDHADAGRWTTVGKLAGTVHVAAAAVWLGGLAAFALAALRNDEREARDVAERFSAVAFAAVALVVVTGTFQSVRQVTTLDATETSYGRLLAVKVVIVLALIGIASLTRSALRGRLSLDGETPVPEERAMLVLRRLAAAELLVALVVVGVTAFLVDADPGAASTATGKPFDETVVVEDVLINVVVVPGTVGPTDIHLYVDDPAGGLARPLDATGSMSSGEVTGIPIELIDAGPGHWSAYDIDIPIAGQWELTVEVLLTEDDTVSATFIIPIGGSQ